MKTTHLRLVMLAFVAIAMSFMGATRASAIGFDIQVGTPPPPPPPHVYRPWARPYPGAVWIDGHNEWIDGRWVWVGGYYGYPPHRGAVWIPAHWRNGYYRPGHWR